jgi:hypothetical protein
MIVSPTWAVTAAGAKAIPFTKTLTVSAALALAA